MITRLLLISLSILLLPILAGTQILPSAQYTTHDGLPQIQVMDLIQDKRGFLWAATKGGIARFDGSNWEIIPLKDKPIVCCLAENTLGDIIAITEGDFGKVIKLNGSEIQVADFNLHKSSAFNIVVQEDTLFNIDFINATLNAYDLNSLKHIGEQNIELSKDRLSHYSQSHGIILKGKNPDTGLYELYDLRKKKYLEISNPPGISSTMKGQVKLWNSKGDIIEIYGPNNFDKQFEIQIKNDKLQEVKALIKQDLYFTFKERNYRYNSTNGAYDELNQMNATRNIFLKDREGNLWNSSDNGIQIFPKTNFRNFSPKALNDAWIFRPFEGQYIYGNYSAGLKSVKFTPFQITPIEIKQPNRIYFGSAIRNAALYIAGSSYITKLKNGKLKSIDIQQTNSPVLSAYYHGHNSQIYFGGRNCLLSLDTDDTVNFFEDVEEVFNRYIVSIAGLGLDKLLCGTYEDLLTFDLKTKEFKSLNHLFPEAKMAGAISIEKDHVGNFWIGNKDGLWFYNPLKDILRHIDEGHIVNPISSIKQIKENMLALGTSKELIILDLESHYQKDITALKTFNHRNGYFGQEVAQNSMFLEGDLLWIPTATKLVNVDVNTLDLESGSSSIFPFSVNDSLLSWSNPHDEVFELPKGENSVAVKFNTVGFNQPKSSLLQYRLSDVDKTWTDWTTEKEVVYNNLKSNIYLLRTRLKTSSYVDGDEYPEMEFRFKVDLPFYKNPDFTKNLFFTFLILGGFFAFLFYTSMRESAEKEKLERQFKLLQVQTLQSQLNPHFLFNVLGTIQSLVLSGDTGNANKYLVAFSKMIRKYLDYNIEAYESMEDRGEKPKNIRLADELEVLEIYLAFEKLKLEDGLNYDIRMGENINKEVIHLPPMLLQPIVENAIEHGIIPKEGPGEILILIDEFEDRIKIEICDDGIGTSESIKLQKDHPRKYKSRGLQLIRDRIQILNSMGDRLEIAIRDNPKGGTITTLILDPSKS